MMVALQTVTAFGAIILAVFSALDATRNDEPLRYGVAVGGTLIWLSTVAQMVLA